MLETETWKPREVRASEDRGAEGIHRFLDGVADLEQLLAQERAIVFRGYGVAPDELTPVMDRILPNRLDYVHGNSPRTKVADQLYTSTEYPAAYTISMHNELSYAHRWPTRLMFFCEIAPAEGGATPVVDGGRWLRALDDDTRERFSGGVAYTQNLHSGSGLGKSWQATFETDDRDRVDAFLTEAGATWEWRREGLRVTVVRPSTITHSITGDEVWFNQADQWHPAGMGDEFAAELARVMPAEELPQSVTFADGSPIPASDVTQIRDCGLDCAVDVNWSAGDLLVVDNVLVGHGRRPYGGDRTVLVAMSG